MSNSRPVISLKYAFVDWINLREANHGQFTTVNDGRVVRISKDNKISYTNDVSLEHVGSYDSSCRIRITEDYAELRYNPSRWNKPDNIFGITIEQVWPQADAIMAALGQKPFTPGTETFEKSPTPIGIPQPLEPVEVGLQITKLDYTINVSTGSKSNLTDYMHYMNRISLPRLTTSRSTNTVYFGKNIGSKSFKIYPKHIELRANQIPKSKYKPYIIEQANHCEQNGVARIEIQLGRMYLARSGLRQSSNITTEQLNQIMLEELPAMTTKIKKLNIDDIPNGPLGTLKMYQSGINVKDRLSQQTYYKHRKLLLEYGYDISRNNISALNPTENVKTITIKAYEPPDDYDWGEAGPPLHLKQN